MDEMKWWREWQVVGKSIGPDIRASMLLRTASSAGSNINQQPINQPMVSFCEGNRELNQNGDSSREISRCTM